MDVINNMMDEIVRQQREHTERTLAEIIENYDFIVGSIECRQKLLEILPEGANVVCSPYIVSPNLIYAIKKFDIMDLLKESPEFESEEKYDARTSNCAGNGSDSDHIRI